MAQTPAKKVAQGDAFDYTAGADLVAGQIIELGGYAFPVEVAVANGDLGALDPDDIWDVPKATGAMSAGDFIYWDNNGTPNLGTALSGAATKTAGGNTALGVAVADAASGDDYVRVKLCREAASATSVPTFTPETVAAAGSVQGDATAIGASTTFAFCTGADATKGVKLPAAAAGKVCVVKNRDSDNAVLKVYPATGDAINAIAANGAISMAAKTSAVFVALDATTWYTVPLVPS